MSGERGQSNYELSVTHSNNSNNTDDILFITNRLGQGRRANQIMNWPSCIQGDCISIEDESLKLNLLCVFAKKKRGCCGQKFEKEETYLLQALSLPPVDACKK